MKATSHKISIAAPLNKVFAALTTPEELKGWYTPNVSGEASEGKELQLDFKERKDTFRWKITDVAPDSVVRWECVEGPGASKGTVAVFRVSDLGDGRTGVECDHEGWPEDHEAFTTCNTLWGVLMGHLKEYVESGKPMPAFA